MENQDVQRMLAAKVRRIAMTVYLGFEALKEVEKLYSQFASLGGDAMANCDDPCFEILPEDALPVTQAQLHATKEALGTVAYIVAQVEPNIPDTAWAALETVNVREEEVK